MKTERDSLTEVAEQVLDWKALKPGQPWQQFEFTAKRLAYTVMDDRLAAKDGSVRPGSQSTSISGTVALAGIPVRNGKWQLNAHLDAEPFVVCLRGTDAFGEVSFFVVPATGAVTVHSVFIDRVLKGGISHSSPQPEEQIIGKLGTFEARPIPVGWHWLEAEAVEEQIKLRIDGVQIAEVTDPDVAGGQLGLGACGTVEVRSLLQVEYITRAEKRQRDKFVADMNAFCRELDAEMPGDIARANSVEVGRRSLQWKYPETGATLKLRATPGGVTAEGLAGLYGNARMLFGMFAEPEVVSKSGQTLRRTGTPKLSGDEVSFGIEIEIASPGGETGGMQFKASLTENATWFCTAEIAGVEVASVSLGFGLDPDFKPNAGVAARAGEPARMVYGTSAIAGESGRAEEGVDDSSRSGFGMPSGGIKSLSTSFLLTDAVVGFCAKALLGHDTAMETQVVGGAPSLILRSERNRFRWAFMWLPYHRLNLTGYKKRMVHFIRQSEVPVQQWREHPDAGVYPSDEELDRYAANATKAMVWHHPWASSNYRQREGFVVNKREMSRAMAKAHKLGIQVIPYIGIVPGRHPALGYEDLSQRMGYDKNWDLQDFTIYSAAGKFCEFFPFITDQFIRQYGIDGYYTDGGLALIDWGNTGLTEADTGLSVEEMNDRLYSRVKRVLRRHGGRFGLENWGAAGVHLAGPWYDCRMIGESFQETSPESYRDIYNPLLTGTPFKMYGMNLVARSRYNVAMAAVCMTDIQMCSGNYSWGNWPDRPSDWANVGPFWKVLDSIDWDDLSEARPWWAQELVEGEGFYAGYYLTPKRLVLFLANRDETAKTVSAVIRLDRLPPEFRRGRIRPIYPEQGGWTPVGDGSLAARLPQLHHGPLGWEVMP